MYKVIKWLVPVLIALILYKKFLRSTVLSPELFFRQLLSLDWYWFVLLPLCSALNWLTEVKKWHFLVSRLETHSFRKAVKGVLSGVAVSQLLPYRTGEYLGRLAFVERANLLNAGILSVAGSFSQLLITLFFGALAFVILRPFQIPLMFLGSLSLLLILLLLGYFYMPFLGRLKHLSAVKAMRESLGILGKTDMLKLLGFSAFRYLSFLVPYALLAAHFGLGNGNTLVYYVLAVSCIFFLQTISPSFILTDIAVRISASAIVFSGSVDAINTTDHIPGLVIYLFNVALPMCAGALVLLLLKIRS